MYISSPEEPPSRLERQLRILVTHTPVQGTGGACSRDTELSSDRACVEQVQRRDRGEAGTVQNQGRTMLGSVWVV